MTPTPHILTFVVAIALAEDSTTCHTNSSCTRDRYQDEVSLISTSNILKMKHARGADVTGTASPAAAASNGRLALLESGEVRQRAGRDFPVNVGNRVFVAAAERIKTILLFDIHIYDVGLYIDPAASIWAQSDITPEAVIEFLPGHATLRYKITTDQADKKKLAKGLKDSLGGRLDDLNARDDGDKFVDFIQSAPQIREGSVMILDLNKDSLQISVDGTDLGELRSSALPKALAATYFDDHGVIPKLRGAVFDRLKKPAPAVDDTGAVTETIDTHIIKGEKRDDKKTIIILLVIAILLVLILAWGVWRCCCRKREAMEL
eukprot:gnl/TRDRNA2_/TRDRNA2_193937_c0_seq1.p1 gnl/TRDRNA2_/TRDRNA2_193937_c0~~gnl/TRDRNA2_/TRDRNA2_193937_c0_seq1.p1  ORF type:complete len:337 (-),score=46.45 gnl/TRDRNA2_/TRDRNA2_193937_c0_seq1:213-1169(-)